MTLAGLRELYAYDRWANRRLLDAVARLGPGEATRPVGGQFSTPTLKGLLAHILGAEDLWLQRLRGQSPTAIIEDADFPDLDALRARWGAVEQGVREFVDALTAAEIDRLVEYRDTQGRRFVLPLWVLLHHVANHSTHHRSEVATMLTMVHGAPPPTDLVVYHLVASGQMTE
jgi:uncharacterized damage-inducible protein DinB